MGVSRACTQQRRGSSGHTSNRGSGESKRWRQTQSGTSKVRLSGEPVLIKTAAVRSASGQFLIWHWYWVAGDATSSDVRAKVQLVLQRLTGASDTAAWVAVYTAVGDDASAGTQRLNAFVERCRPIILARTTAADYRQPAVDWRSFIRFDIGPRKGVVNLIIDYRVELADAVGVDRCSPAFANVCTTRRHYLSLPTPGHLLTLDPRLMRVFRERGRRSSTRALAALEAVVPAWAPIVPRASMANGRALPPDGPRRYQWYAALHSVVSR